MQWLEVFKWLTSSKIHARAFFKCCVVFEPDFVSSSVQAIGLLVKLAHNICRNARRDYNSHQAHQFQQLFADSFDAFLRFCKMKLKRTWQICFRKHIKVIDQNTVRLRHAIAVVVLSGCQENLGMVWRLRSLSLWWTWWQSRDFQRCIRSGLKMLMMKLQMIYLRMLHHTQKQGRVIYLFAKRIQHQIILFKNYSKECGKREVLRYKRTRHGRPLRKGKTGIWPPETRIKNQKFLEKPEINSLIPIIWLNSCNYSLFASMTLTLHKIQVHCFGIMQWWACSSLNTLLCL